MYDWSVSVYNLVITSSIFPIYFASVVVNAQGGDMIKILGFEIKNSVLYSYSLTCTFLLIAIASPILTAIADYSGRRKAFMQFFCIVGGLACCTMFFFKTSTIMLGVAMFMLAGIGFSGSFVFYNSYLPEIATEDQMDRVSARGFSMGYIGSVILLIFNLLMLMMPQYFGNISNGMACKLSFLSVGIWWILFAQYTFYYLPKDIHKHERKKGWILNGFKELKKVYHQVMEMRKLKYFLLSFFFYNMGVQTVMYVATIFAEKELHLPSSNLITTVLILQLIAIPGAILTSKLSAKIGNIPTIISEVVIWIGICACAYFVTNGNEFYVLAAVVGLVMGGIQSISRSTYSKLIPANTKDTASFFSFYEVSDKLSIVAGTFFYGFTEAITGSARNSVLALGICFIISIVILVRLNKINK
jgi:UMF1 family MFS transporter